MDGIDLALGAGLNYRQDDSPGYQRRRRGRGFSYADDHGARPDDPSLERIRSLVIPPAWTDVWISPDPKSHLQATGFDAAGRKQYIYHQAWEEARDEFKFERMADFGRRVPKLRRAIDSDMKSSSLSKARVVALAVAVLDRTLIRVGNRSYADENEAYGLTTLTNDHVAVDGLEVHFEFSAKGGLDHEAVLRDRRLAGLIAKCQDLSGQTLFSYESDTGPASVSSSDVNAYVADAMRGSFTAKDFRTWGASSTVVGRVAIDNTDDADKRLLEAIDYAAEKLGNTREVCRDSYLHPIVQNASRDGSLETAWRQSRTGRWLDRAESTLNRLLRSETAPG